MNPGIVAIKLENASDGRQQVLVLSGGPTDRASLIQVDGKTGALTIADTKDFSKRSA